jgi:hypothetical protein
MALKTIYFDPSAPDAGANGTYANPYTKQTQLTYAVIGNDCNVMCKRGILFASDKGNGVFYATGLLSSGQVTWMPYGDAEMPPTAYGGIVFKPGDAGWTYLGDGIWKRVITGWTSSSTFPKQTRLFLGAGPTGPVQNRSPGTGYRIGTPISRAAVKETAATVTEAEVIAALHHTNNIGGYRDWMLVSDVPGGVANLYVYTGSALLDPPTFYDGIVITASTLADGASAQGAYAGIRTGVSTNQLFRGLDVVHTQTGIYLGGTATDGVAGENNRVEDCRVFGMSAMGLAMYGTTTARIVRGCSAKNILIDMCSTPLEPWGYGEKVSGISWINTAMDVAQIGEYTQDCSFHNVTAIVGSVHAVFQFGSQVSANAGNTVGAVMNDCKAIGVNSDYGYPITSIAVGAANVARVNRFQAQGIPNFMHIVGEGKTLLQDCIFKDASKPNPAYSITTGDGSGGEYTGNEICWEPGIDVYTYAPHSYGIPPPGCITAVRCTFLQPYGPMLQVTDNSAVMSAGVMDFTDCTFVDTRWINYVPARRYGELLPRPGMSLDMRSDGKTAGLIKFTNCTYYTGIEGGAILAAATNPVPPLVTMASYAGIDGSPSADDPMVDSSGYLSDASPLKYTATTQGTFDVQGRRRSNPTSSGAHEFVEPRPSRLAA